MRAAYAFFKVTAIGGAIFLVPIVIFALIFNKALSYMRSIALLFSGLFKIDSVDDVLILNIFSVVILILACFIAGLVARTRPAKSLVGFLEDKILDRIPFYLFIKSMTGGIPDHHEKVLKPVWVRLDDYSQLAFEVERQEDGRVVVFLPGAPNPWSGSVAIVEANRVTPSAMTMIKAVSNLSHLGATAKTSKHAE